MITVDVNEFFYLTVTLIDSMSMGSGEQVNYVIEDSSYNVVDSGVLTENTTYSGTYSKEVSLSVYGDYIAYFYTTGYPTGMEYIKVKEESIIELIKQNRQTNLSVENVFAGSDIPNRNVEAGKTDYVIIKIKNDADSDWDNPAAERRIYAWYANMGDDQPIYMGEES